MPERFSQDTGLCIGLSGMGPRIREDRDGGMVSQREKNSCQ